MSTISKEQFKQFIENFDFIGLFNQLGWTYLDEQTPVRLKEETYLFYSVAEKGGFRILVFKPVKHQDLPDYATRLQLDRKIGKLFREHLIIFCDKNDTTQIWQLFIKQLGKPSRLSETRWHKGQEPELLYQKTSNLFFTLDQEENITIADVVDVVNENFSKNVDQVTKKFYESFRKEHKKFIELIKGISVVTDREWYASLMLNRLMFCYFIQKKGFLDKNLNYLKEKLTYCQTKKGKDKFYVSFYKNFLLALFHQGLGSPDQSEELKKEIGKIPYLNGGLFDVHELERLYENIDISDKAFETIFNFFDQYNWHLDTNISASGKDINPDVIGFIFEKYINDRAQMGAYYTKEDITDYISKNCIIPFLFDETERKYAKVLKPEAEIMQILKESGDTYIYDAVKKGVDIPLPKEIEIGIDTIQPNLIERRKDWNKPASEEYSLPTEIWREVVDRRKRYTEIKEKIEKGEITQINDFITYNLNIRQFTQDIIDSHSDPDFVRHFYEALSNITIIDPTCGSGAFLFAAMNILEPLYESCIQRMRNFIEDEIGRQLDFPSDLGKEKLKVKTKYEIFSKELNKVFAPEHPNLKYFIFKNIILRNLYGVDIMKEAVEIAKLRLFLKLVATVEADYKKPNLGLEPLPDIDFNIRSGNTLIGYATKKEIDDLQGMFVTPKMKEKILEECDLVSRAFQRFKEIQLKGYENKKEFTKAKTELNNRLDKLAGNLNKILYKQHYESMDYEKWLVTHQPFHWFAEFYEIINGNGGFDVVIGNPPYVEYSKVVDTYKIINYRTERSGNLYAFVMERVTNIIGENGTFSFIILMASITTKRMSHLRRILQDNFKNNYFLNLAGDWHPGRLFDGVRSQFSIFVGNNQSNTPCTYTSNYIRWANTEREFLTISKLNYINNKFINTDDVYPKFGIPIEISIWNKILKNKNSLPLYFRSSGKKLFYRNAGIAYYQIAINFQQKFTINGQPSVSSTLKSILTESVQHSNSLAAILNSNIFSWYYFCFSDCYHLTSGDFNRFKIDINKGLIERLTSITPRLMTSLNETSIIKTTNYKTKGEIIYQEFYPRHSKSIIDEIDTVLAEHYGFTEEELDFIINYDIKYRMGKELENGEDE